MPLPEIWDLVKRFFLLSQRSADVSYKSLQGFRSYPCALFTSVLLAILIKYRVILLPVASVYTTFISVPRMSERICISLTVLFPINRNFVGFLFCTVAQNTLYKTGIHNKKNCVNIVISLHKVIGLCDLHAVCAFACLRILLLTSEYQTNFYETWYVYHGTWAHLNYLPHKSLPSVCMYVYPSIFARQRPRKTLPWQRIYTKQQINFWTRRFLCSQYRIEGK
jgi:hypothetical protein